MFRILVHGVDRVASSHPLSAHPLYIGRGAGNDIILLDDAASVRHFRVWADPDGVHLEDLGSRNGTWVNGARIVGTVALTSGDQVRVGASVHLSVAPGDATTWAVPTLEDLDLGIRYLIRSDRFTFGAALGSDVVVPGAEERATLLVDRDGVVRLGRSEELVELAIDEVFTVAGRRFCLRRPEADPRTTRDLLLPHELTRTQYGYTVDVRLRGALGPEAVIQDPTRGIKHTITAENPTLLLYLLARRHEADLRANVPPADAGWVGDDELAVGIWGRAEAEKQASNLNVLVWRLRRELQSGGFDPWCLEKRRRNMRLRVQRVTVE